VIPNYLLSNLETRIAGGTIEDRGIQKEKAIKGGLRPPLAPKGSEPSDWQKVLEDPTTVRLIVQHLK
jgi:hypothetical protein